MHPGSNIKHENYYYFQNTNNRILNDSKKKKNNINLFSENKFDNVASYPANKNKRLYNHSITSNFQNFLQKSHLNDFVESFGKSIKNFDDSIFSDKKTHKSVLEKNITYFDKKEVKYSYIKEPKYELVGGLQFDQKEENESFIVDKNEKKLELDDLTSKGDYLEITMDDKDNFNQSKILKNLYKDYSKKLSDYLFTNTKDNTSKTDRLSGRILKNQEFSFKPKEQATKSELEKSKDSGKNLNYNNKIEISLKPILENYNRGGIVDLNPIPTKPQVRKNLLNQNQFYEDQRLAVSLRRKEFDSKLKQYSTSHKKKNKLDQIITIQRIWKNYFYIVLLPNIVKIQRNFRIYSIKLIIQSKKEIDHILNKFNSLNILNDKWVEYLKTFAFQSILNNIEKKKFDLKHKLIFFESLRKSILKYLFKNIKNCQKPLPKIIWNSSSYIFYSKKIRIIDYFISSNFKTRTALTQYFKEQSIPFISKIVKIPNHMQITKLKNFSCTKFIFKNYNWATSKIFKFLNKIILRNRLIKFLSTNENLFLKSKRKFFITLHLNSCTRIKPNFLAFLSTKIVRNILSKSTALIQKNWKRNINKPKSRIILKSISYTKNFQCKLHEKICAYFEFPSLKSIPPIIIKKRNSLNSFFINKITLIQKQIKNNKLNLNNNKNSLLSKMLIIKTLFPIYFLKSIRFKISNITRIHPRVYITKEIKNHERIRKFILLNKQILTTKDFKVNLKKSYILQKQIFFTKKIKINNDNTFIIVKQNLRNLPYSVKKITYFSFDVKKKETEDFADIFMNIQKKHFIKKLKEHSILNEKFEFAMKTINLHKYLKNWKFKGKKEEDFTKDLIHIISRNRYNVIKESFETILRKNISQKFVSTAFLSGESDSRNIRNSSLKKTFFTKKYNINQTSKSTTKTNIKNYLPEKIKTCFLKICKVTFDKIYQLSLSKKNFNDFVDFFTHYLEFRIKMNTFNDLKNFYMKNRINQLFRYKFILEIQRNALIAKNFIRARDFIVKIDNIFQIFSVKNSFRKILVKSLYTIEDNRKSILFELLIRGTNSNYFELFNDNPRLKYNPVKNNDNIFNYYKDFIRKLKMPNQLRVDNNRINLNIEPQIKEISLPFSLNFHSPEKSRKKEDFEEDVINISRHNKTCVKEDDFDISHSQFSVGKSFQFSKLKKQFQMASKKLMQGTEFEKSIMLRDEFNDEFS